jgi:DNA-binding transcriptional MerR regulator
MTIDRVTGPLTVGQLAARVGVRADTIRYYERSGLLPEPNRTDGDHRRYGPADLDRMLFIRGAQRLGLRLAEIKVLLAVRDTGVCPCGPAETLLSEHIGEIDREIARLARLRADLARMVVGLSGQSGPCPDPVPGTWCAADRQEAESNAGGGDRNVLVLR